MAANVHDASTQGFIDENPVVVTIERRKRVPQKGGSWKWEHFSYVPEQQCRQVFKGNLNDISKRTLADGRVVRIDSSLVFLLGADIEEGDIVTLGDDKYEVSRVTDRYDTKAEVFRYAGA